MDIDWSKVFKDVGGYFSDNASTVAASGLGAGGLALALRGYEDIGDIGQQAYKAMSGTYDEAGNLITPGLAQELQGMLQFQPYTVTSATGGQFGMTQDPTTGQFTYDLQLSPEEQALATGLQAGATGMLPQATTRTTTFDPITAQALSQAGTTLGTVGTQDVPMALQRAGVGSLFSQQLAGIGQPTGLEGLTQQALMGGQQRIAGATAPSDLQALQQQYAGLAGTAAAGLDQPRAAREQEVYERIRAVQTPEEERQRLNLEQRLASQGRLGVRTAQFGGTPEQLALAQAQEEAQNRAALAAMQQAGTEQQQQFQQALGLAGQTGQLAQLGSGLESQALQRGMGLSQLGLAGTQAGAGLEAQRLQQLLGLQQADIGAASAQQALQQGRLGMAGGMFDISRTAAGLPAQLQSADLANLQGMMAAGYVPQAQLLNALQPGMTAAERARQAQAQQAGTYGQTYASGLEALLQSGLGQASLAGGFGANIANTALGGLFSS